jgi:photoactive yellow protein
MHEGMMSMVSVLHRHEATMGAVMPGFGDPRTLDWLESATDQMLDDAPYGIVAMSADAVVLAYNRAESEVARLNPSRVIGQHFFRSVAPCTNNAMIARRFETESVLDATIDYVFTLRMLPTPVRLRMLRSFSAQRMYLLVERRTVRDA